MKKNTLLNSIVISILMLVGVYSPAFAEGPEFEEMEFLDVFDVPCNGFYAHFEDNIRIRLTTFFDDDGNPASFIMHVRISGYITHSETGQSFRDQATEIFSGELPPDEKSEVVVGVPFHLTVPGEGVVTLAAGRVILDANGNIIFGAGPNTDYPGELYELVCVGLAGL